MMSKYLIETFFKFFVCFRMNHLLFHLVFEDAWEVCVFLCGILEVNCAGIKFLFLAEKIFFNNLSKIFTMYHFIFVQSSIYLCCWFNS